MTAKHGPVFVEAYCLGGTKMGFCAETLGELDAAMRRRLPPSVVVLAIETLERQIAAGKRFPNVVFFLAGPIGLEDFVAVAR